MYRTALKPFLFFLLYILAFQNIQSQCSSTQSPFGMGTYTTTLCRAKFFDDGCGPGNAVANNYLSGGGSPTSNTLTIINGNPVITMTFDPSPGQTKIAFGDDLSFYNSIANMGAGVSINNFTYTGVNIPSGSNLIPNIVSNTGTLIVVWRQNGSIQDIGWNGGWYSTVNWPSAPTTTISPAPACNANQVTVVTNSPICCDSVKPNYFIINGPMFPGIASAVPVSCSNGTTSTIQLNLINPINKNCTYTVNSTLFIIDNCDSAHKFPNIINTFSIANCPVTPTIQTLPSNTVCSYNCNATLTAITEATNCLNFTYQWSHGLGTGPGPHTVCPGVTTVYSCTLTEVTTSVSTVTTQTVYVIDPQINPIANYTICQSTPNFNFTGTPTAGVWSASPPGCINATTGAFSPGCSAPGIKWIKYTVGGCRDSVQLEIVALNMGSNDAGCTGEPPFQVTGGTPAGGTWGGSSYIDATGTFTPSTAGNHTVTYTYGACTGTKTVYVSSLTIPATTYSICQSVWYQNLTFTVSPPGGRFFGTGITNQVAGTFSPTLAGPGTHVITYSLASGCNNTFAVHVKPIYATPSITTCPSHAPFVLPTFTPGGGVWSGTTGIVNSSTGLYDPSVGGLTTHTDVLIYTFDGCTDTTISHAIVTTIVDDTLYFCDNSPGKALSTYTALNHFPPNGVFTGPGVTFAAGVYSFNPSTAGVGIHTVYYDLNTCRDSVKMIVYPSSYPTTQDSIICSTRPPYVVANMPFGTTWHGTGIVNPNTGLFDPGSVGTGTFQVYYTNRAGCGSGTVTIVVYQFAPANISGLNNVYCFQDSNYVFTYGPPDGLATGTLTATWGTPTTTFNPSVIGAGNYTITYNYGSGHCFTTNSVSIKIHPQLVTSSSLSKDTICAGESAVISVTATGGPPSSVPNFTYTWSNNLNPVKTNTVVPPVTTVYTVMTSDGCSDPVIDSFRVVVSPQFFPEITTSPIKCFGEDGFAAINITPTQYNYSYKWNTNPAQTTATVTGVAGKNYQVKLKNLDTGCERDTSVKIPSYNVIKAGFSPNPNLSCVPYVDNLITFIDLSNGGVTGNWSFNGTQVPYVPGESPQHRFVQAGTFNITLQIFNEGNCTDSKSLQICVEESTEIFLPDIFSPNGDGVNDVLFVRGGGIKEVRFMIYDRWGQKVFETNTKDIGWDGKYKGKEVDPAVYVYYLEVTMLDNNQIIRKGDVTLVR